MKSRSETPNLPMSDYRKSHCDVGDEYDRNLAQSPYDAFMTSRETDVLKRIIPAIGGQRRGYLDFACGTGRIMAVVSQDFHFGVAAQNEGWQDQVS